MAEVRDAVLAVVPDEPVWVEARAIALDDDAWAIPVVKDGWVLGADGARLIVSVGPVEVGAIALGELAERERASGDDWTMLAAIERDDVAERARAAGRPVARARVATLGDPSTVPELDGAVVLPDDADLAHLPAGLADEIARARAHRPVWTAYVDGKPASFAYAPWRSERWFDVSVDTAPGYRQLGLAVVVASAMIHGERALGREAVWGADEDNAPSLRLAARLGFTDVGALWVVA
jgi:L-amino acid N-acyltransferase YncA